MENWHKKRKINSKIDRRISDSDPVLTTSFSEELYAGILSMKKGKVVGLDNIFVEEVKHFGPKAKSWLLQFFNSCLSTQGISKIWSKAKVIALLKPGKGPSSPKSYRLISLLSHLYKLHERLLLFRLIPVAEKISH